MNFKFARLSFICCFLLLALQTFAQVKLSGTIADGSDNVKLQKATIALLNPKDSILVNFARTTENGSFAIPKLDTGMYKLIISYPQYADYVEDIHVLKNHDWG